MSNTVHTNETTSNSPSQSVGFGEELKTARKKRGLSIEAVAEELNILKRHAEAIEAEDFEALPQRAFARGFVANYAKIVGLDAEAMLQRFDASYPSHLKQENADTIKTPLNPMGTLKRGNQTPIRLNFALIAGIIAALVLAVAVLKMVNSATTKTEAMPSQDGQVADSLSVTEQAQGAAIGSSGSALAVGTSDSAGSALAVGGSGVLDFWVKEVTVITVTDGTGKVLMTGEQKRGGYQLSGQAPFKVEIANPSNVDLNYNKNPVALNEKVVTLQ